MGVDIQKLFNETLPAGLKEHAAAAVSNVGNKFQINITGEGGGSWFINATDKDGGPKSEAGTGEGADVTITVSVEDFNKLMEDPQKNGVQLFFAGKLKMTGNPMLAQKLSQLFAYAPKAG